MPEVLIAVRVVHFAATLMAAGVVAFSVMVAEPVFRRAGKELAPAIERLRRQWTWIVWLSLAAALVSGAAWLLLLAAQIYDVPASDVALNQISTVVTQTRFGHVWSVRLAAAAALAGLAAVPKGRSPRLQNWLGLLFAAALLASLAWTGHAGAAPGLSGALLAATDASHLLAAGAWLGGLPPLAMLLAVARAAKQADWGAVVTAAVRRFSWLGIASVGLLLASGLINTWVEVGTVGNLIDTTYGRLVTLKLVLFAAMIALATVNRFHLTPRLTATGAARRLQHNAVAEALLGLAAVAAVGVLGTMAPASHAQHHLPYGAMPADVAYTHIHGVGGMADVVIAPGHVGTAQATIRLSNDDFAPLAAKAVTFTLTPPAAGASPITRMARPRAEAEWQVDAVGLSQPGDWTVALDVALDSSRHLLLDAPIVIAPDDGPAPR